MSLVCNEDLFSSFKPFLKLIFKKILVQLFFQKMYKNISIPFFVYILYKTKLDNQNLIPKFYTKIDYDVNAIYT